MSLKDDNDVSLSPYALQALKDFYTNNQTQSIPLSQQSYLNNKNLDNNYKYNEAEMNKQFKDKEYWESRFAVEEDYEWLVGYNDIKDVLLPKLLQTDKILIIGCGNSNLSQMLYDDGYENITNIDYSKTVINKCILKNSKRSRMAWITMDMTKLTFDEESFDIVIDKASMDALTVDEEDVWDPNIETISLVDNFLHGVSKCLKIKGKFIQITFSQPHFRTKYLIGSRANNKLDNIIENSLISPYQSVSGFSERYNWVLDTPITIEKEIGCLATFMYIMTKGKQ